MEIAGTVIVAIAVLTVFLTCITALKYAVKDTFARTRLIMTAFFIFIVVTLTLSFYDRAPMTFPYTVPIFLIGMLMGWLVGVKEAKRRIMMEGLNHYLEHFAHITIADLKALRWWAIINFYTVIGALGLINLVGLANVIYKGDETLAILASSAGAFLLGTIVPYLWHLWSLKIKQMARVREEHSTQQG